MNASSEYDNLILEYLDRPIKELGMLVDKMDGTLDQLFNRVNFVGVSKDMLESEVLSRVGGRLYDVVDEAVESSNK